MKVFPFKIPKTREQALLYQRDEELILYDKLHQHEEIQVSYIERGEGVIIVGDTVTDYIDGDILVFGSNLPHVLRSEKRNNAENPYSLVHTVFFTTKSFGDKFFQLPELKSLEFFFESIKNGLKIEDNKNEIGQLIKQFAINKEIDNLVNFLKLLHLLNRSNKKILSSFSSQKQLTDTEGKRMQAIFEYVMNNYDQNISLNKVADIANMSKNAFCRYFKVRTNKTFFEFLIDLRIEKASRFLIKKEDLSIAEIADSCGFNNISHFNRKFKEIKGFSPLQFKKRQTIKNPNT